MAWGDLIHRLKQLSGISTRDAAVTQERKAVRVVHQFSMMALRPNGETVPLLAVDCAATGLRVECSSPLPRKELLSLAVRGAKVRPDTSETQAPRARVVWSRKKKAEGLWQLGLAFVLDTPEQRSAIAQFLLKDCRLSIARPQESRRAPRVTSNARALVKEFGREDVPVTLKNLSVGGISLLCEQRFSVGTRLDFTLFLEGVPRPMTGRADVLRVRQLVPGTFEIALAFAGLDDAQRESIARHLRRALATG